MTFDPTAVRARLAAITPGPWTYDATKNEGSYGSGPDTHEGFDSYQVLGEVRGKEVVICDCVNSDVIEVLVEDGDDENGGSAWDDQGRKNMEFVASAPADLAAACDEIERRRSTEAMIRNMIYNLEQAKTSTHPGNADTMPMVDSAVIVRALRGAIGLGPEERP